MCEPLIGHALLDRHKVSEWQLANVNYGAVGATAMTPPPPMPVEPGGGSVRWRTGIDLIGPYVGYGSRRRVSLVDQAVTGSHIELGWRGQTQRRVQRIRMGVRVSY